MYFLNSVTRSRHTWLNCSLTALTTSWVLRLLFVLCVYAKKTWCLRQKVNPLLYTVDEASSTTDSMIEKVFRHSHGRPLQMKTQCFFGWNFFIWSVLIISIRAEGNPKNDAFTVPLVLVILYYLEMLIGFVGTHLFYLTMTMLSSMFMFMFTFMFSHSIAWCHFHCITMFWRRWRLWTASLNLKATDRNILRFSITDHVHCSKSEKFAFVI